MKTLILTDIFGKKYISSKFLELFEDLIILDPYEQLLEFKDEQEAYETYIKICGHENYFKKALKLCKKENIELIVGFSAGGTVAYRLSEQKLSYLPSLKKVISFYPSQIRNHLDLNPKVYTNIVFAKKESSFDTKEVNEVLLRKNNIQTIISEYEHGFMNEKSKNYNKKAFLEYSHFIKKQLTFK